MNRFLRKRLSLVLFVLLSMGGMVSCHQEEERRRSELSPEANQVYSNGRRLFFEGKFAEAAESFRRTFEMSAADGSAYVLAIKYEGLCHQYLDNYPRAKECFAKGLQLETYYDGRADSLNNLGWLAYLEGKLEESIGLLAEAERVIEPGLVPMNDRKGDSLLRTIWINHARVLTDLGRFDEARARLERCLNYVQDDDHGMNASRLYTTLGDLERIAGDRDVAGLFYQKAIGAASDPSLTTSYNVAYLADSRTRYADFLTESGQYAQALEVLQVALKTARRLRSNRLQAAALAAVAKVYRELGDTAASHTASTQALAILDGIDLPHARAEIEIELALDDLHRGEPQKALRRLQEVSVDGPMALLSANRLKLGLARAHAALGNLDRSIEAYLELAAQIDKFDIRMLATEDRFRFWSSQSAIYEELALQLKRTGRSKESFEAAERGRAKTLHDLDLERSTGISREMRAILSTRSRLEDRLKRAQRKDLEEELIQEIRICNSRLQKQLQQPVIKNRSDLLPAVSQRLASQHGVLVAFSLMDTQSLVWVVSEGETIVYELPGEEEIRRQVMGFRERLSGPPVGPAVLSEFASASSDLFNFLFAPVKTRIQQAHALTFIPEGVLTLLPFEALVHDKDFSQKQLELRGFLGDKLVEYSPSTEAWLSSEYEPKLSSSNSQLLAVSTARPSNPPGSGESPPVLEFAGKEISRISQLYPHSRQLELSSSESFLDDAALAEYSIIHFAGHASIDATHPFQSGLIVDSLAGRSLLRARDLARLRLNAKLVTMAACETGLGRTFPGEGILGLCTAFFQAGVKDVMAVMWKSDDEASYAFMTAFYEALANGSTPAEAARKARGYFFESGPPAYRFPYFWAPFVYIRG